jgi:hypothetical protein
MAHLTPEQFVDIADGVLAESGSEVAPHLSACAECRQQLAEMRAIMTEAADVDVPEPSPLFWDHLSARVSAAVSEEPGPRSWREWLLRPLILVPSIAGVLVAALFVVLLTRPALAPLPPAPPPGMVTATVRPSPSPDSAARASVSAIDASLPPLGSADDPQLGLVADYGTSLDWEEMRDEIALGAPGALGASSDALVGALTVEEQRELQRLLADEMAQRVAPGNRS